MAGKPQQQEEAAHSAQQTRKQKAMGINEDRTQPAATFLFSPENRATPSEGFYHIN